MAPLSGLRVCVIGAGIAGLSAALHLREAGAGVVVLERERRPGGRAGVEDGAEHCPRILLDDYQDLFAILRRIPSPTHRTVHASLRRVVRYCHVPRRGWVPLTHLYRFRSREIGLGDRLDIARHRLRSPLVAESVVEPNTNSYGSLRNYRPSSIVRVAANVLRSRDGYAFDGRTDELLVRPWMRHLTESGIEFRPGTAVERVASYSDGALIRAGGTWEQFDDVVVATHLSDAVELLPATATARRRAALRHTHCVCLTIDLDPREPVLASGDVALYCREGFSMLVQPRGSRCVALCVRTTSTEPSWAAARVGELLGLRYPPSRIGVRTNRASGQSLYTAEHLHSRELITSGSNVEVVGSYLRSSYPLDSGECAARSAVKAVQRIVRRRAGTPAGSTIPSITREGAR